MMWVRERSFSDMDDLRVIGTDRTARHVLRPGGSPGKREWFEGPVQRPAWASAPGRPRWEGDREERGGARRGAVGKLLRTGGAAPAAGEPSLRGHRGVWQC